MLGIHGSMMVSPILSHGRVLSLVSFSLSVCASLAGEVNKTAATGADNKWWGKVRPVYGQPAEPLVVLAQY